MANYDIMCFLEYYADRNSTSSGGFRQPTRKWQNFYQTPQQFAIDAGIAGTYTYLAFEVSGFGAVESGAMNDLSINLAAVADVVDLTQTAMNGDAFVIASLVIQDIGFNNIDPGSAAIVASYSGGLHSASINDTSVSWTVNPMISKTKSQVPTRKISSSILAKKQGQ